MSNTFLTRSKFQSTQQLSHFTDTLDKEIFCVPSDQSVMENAQWALLLTDKKHIKLITFLTHTSQTNLCFSNITIMHWVGECILYILVEFTAPISHFPIPDSLYRTQESLIKAPSVRRTNYMQARKNFDVKWILWIQLKLKFYQSSQLMPLWSCDWYSASSNLQFGPNFRNSQPRSVKVHLN